MRPRIAVIGKDGEIPDKIQKISERIGEDIAKNNGILICGGRGGVMEFACKGAKKANGITVGILPSADKNEANPYVDVPITTSMSYARNALIVSCSDVIIAVNGSVGTLSEIALALNYKKPVVAVKTSGGVTDTIGASLGEEKEKLKVYFAEPENAVCLALSLMDH